MDDVTLIGVDLAKRVFHVHGAARDGSVVFRKKLSRAQFSRYMECHPRCIVAMEACGSAHHWGRLIAGFGHEVRLVPPVCAKQCSVQYAQQCFAECFTRSQRRHLRRFVH